MNKNLKNLLKTLLFLSIGVIILYVVYLKFNSDFQKDCVAKVLHLKIVIFFQRL